MTLEEHAQAYSIYYKYVFKVANNVLHNYYDAEDVVHDVFLELSKIGIEDYEIGEMKPWFLVVTRHTALKYKNKFYHLDTCEFNEELALNPNRQDSTITKMIAREMFQQLNEHNPKWAKLLYYNKFCGYTCNEIGTKLGLSPITVKVSIFRAKKYLNERNEAYKKEFLDFYIVCISMYAIELTILLRK